MSSEGNAARRSSGGKRIQFEAREFAPPFPGLSPPFVQKGPTIQHRVPSAAPVIGYSRSSTREDTELNRRISALETSNAVIGKEVQLHSAKLDALEQNMAIFYHKLAEIEAKRKS